MITSLFRNTGRVEEWRSRGWSPFDRLHLMLPFIALLVGLMLEYTGFDLRFEATFFDAKLHLFPWRDQWFFKDVLHEGGRLFLNMVGVVNLLGFLGSFFFAPLAPYRKLLGCLFLAMLSGPLLVGWLKNTTHIYSPWDLAFFGGKQEYVKLLDAVPQGAPVGHAFPAGHASGGFALVATYFALGMVCPQRRFWGLAAGLLLGFLFGLAQQARGAHFLSHDLFSLAVCWCSSWLVFALFYGRDLTRRIESRFG